MTSLEKHIETLEDNDVMANVNGHLVPTTIDSGAKISIVPKEFIKSDEFVYRRNFEV